MGRAKISHELSSERTRAPWQSCSFSSVQNLIDASRHVTLIVRVVRSYLPIQKAYATSADPSSWRSCRFA
eukprot:5418902-Pyramimonas_sp.AAC.1